MQRPMPESKVMVGTIWSWIGTNYGIGATASPTDGQLTATIQEVAAQGKGIITEIVGRRKGTRSNEGIGVRTQVEMDMVVIGEARKWMLSVRWHNAEPKERARESDTPGNA